MSCIVLAAFVHSNSQMKAVRDDKYNAFMNMTFYYVTWFGGVE